MYKHTLTFDEAMDQSISEIHKKHKDGIPGYGKLVPYAKIKERIEQLLGRFMQGDEPEIFMEWVDGDHDWIE